MLLKLRLENREPFDVAVPAESGEVDDVESESEGDVKAVRNLRSELRGWRGWNLFAAILGGGE